MKRLPIVAAQPQFVESAAVTQGPRGVPACTQVLVSIGRHWHSAISDVLFCGNQSGAARGRFRTGRRPDWHDARGAKVGVLRTANGAQSVSPGPENEVFFHQVPCVTLREKTEWAALVTLGWIRLGPPNDAVGIFVIMQAGLGTRGAPGEPYRDGDASGKFMRLLSRGFAPVLAR